MQRLSTGIVLTLAILLILTWGPAATADKVEDLEARVGQLEKQNAQLVQQLQELLGEMRQQKEVVSDVVEQQKEGVAEISDFIKNTNFGGDSRLRGVSLNSFWNFDTAGYDDDWEFYRFRNRLWLDTRPMEGLRFYFRASNEYRWGDDNKDGTLTPFTGNLDDAIGRKDIVVDNAYLEWINPLDIEPLTLKIGRQDLIYGEGFMILDGQDNVGSALIAFDGIKSSIQLGEETTLDLICMKIEDRAFNAADDEDLYGGYLTDTSVFEDHKLEAYVLHRNQNDVKDYLAGALSPKQHTTAIGGRVSGSFLDNALTYAIEGNYQFGEIEDATGFYFAGTDSYGEGNIDREAYGGYIWAKYTFLDNDWQPFIKLTGLFTSGDDPDTEDYEGFDTFYAEWPKFSEGMIYQLYDPFHPLKGGTDGDLGAWSNMIIARVDVGAKPTEDMGVTLSYQHLWADEETGLGDDTDRGDMVLGILTYNFNKNLSGHLLGEYFWPDDYYPHDADNAFFARYELMLKF